MFDIIVVGAGPAGLAAAITLASEGRSVLVLEKSGQAGGQAGTSSLIENYPPFPSGFSGAQFSSDCCAQCEKFGVEVRYHNEVHTIVPRSQQGISWYNVYTAVDIYHARVVLIAAGLANKWLGIAGEQLPQVHHGMNMGALCEAAGKRVVLVGGGNSVGQAALYYLDHGAQVTIIAHHPLRETMSDYLLKRLSGKTQVYQQSLRYFLQQPDGKLHLVSNENAYGALHLWDVDCVHIFIGQRPATDWLRGLVNLDKDGYIQTDQTHQTTQPGIFAVGDVVSDSVRRVACAVGYGNAVVPHIHRYLDNLDHIQK